MIKKGNLLDCLFLFINIYTDEIVMRKFIVGLAVLIANISLAQSRDSISSETYLEDQFYIGVTYNSLYKLPKGIGQNGFSNGIFFGYIKDLPINKKGDFGLGIGLGYGRNTYFQDLKIEETNGATIFEAVGSFDRNKFSFHTIELPIEIRWRTSTATKYKFWRIYTGVKMGYVFASNAKLKKDGVIRVKGIKEVQKLQYGLTLGAGFGTWNLNVYYGLNDIFSSDALINRTEVPVRGRDLRIGLIFYIL